MAEYEKFQKMIQQRLAAAESKKNDPPEEPQQNNSRKRAASVRDNETDDSQPNCNNPASTEVILISEEETAMDTDQFPELNTTNTEELLRIYKINQSKTVKVEHHIHFLEDSIKEFKIPKGLQINKEYPVIDETEDFRAHIREIQLNAELEIVNTILTHYHQLFKTLCSKNKILIKKLEDLTTTTPNLGKKTQEIDKPIKLMKSKLQEKRTKKLNNIKTHTQRGENYVTKKKEPKQTRTNQPPDHQRRPRAPHQHYRDTNYQPPPRRPNRDTSYRPPRRHQKQPFDNYQSDDLQEYITYAVQNVMTEMFYQDSPWRTPY